MDFFTDSQWENSHHAYAAAAVSQHVDLGAEPTRSPSVHDAADGQRSQHADASRLTASSSHVDDYSHYSQHMPPQDQSQQYHDMLLNDQFLSPELSLHNTPLLSPHALTPLPASVPQDFTMPPAAVSSAHLTPHRRMSGKVSKQSPPMRWRSSSLPEDEFRLGDAALDESVSVATIMDLAPRPQEDLDERLRSAIAATAASSQSSSRRTSSVGSNSTRVTPRIRPRLGSSADPSPLLAPNNPGMNGSGGGSSSGGGGGGGGGSGALEEEVDQAFLKSNYRNLMDGTHKHLNFPAADRLTNELRAKKTVHKLAEQERRNRMNVAISELSGVMGAQSDSSGASKAATVERATQYIRKLVERIRKLEERVAELEQTPAPTPAAANSSPGPPPAAK